MKRDYFLGPLPSKSPRQNPVLQEIFTIFLFSVITLLEQSVFRGIQCSNVYLFPEDPIKEQYLLMTVSPTFQFRNLDLEETFLRKTGFFINNQLLRNFDVNKQLRKNMRINNRHFWGPVATVEELLFLFANASMFLFRKATISNSAKISFEYFRDRLVSGSSYLLIFLFLLNASLNQREQRQK